MIHIIGDSTGWSASSDGESVLRILLQSFTQSRKHQDDGQVIDQAAEEIKQRRHGLALRLTAKANLQTASIVSLTRAILL